MQEKFSGGSQNRAVLRTAAKQGIMARDPFDLTGRRALVTGASRGIGLAVAAALIQRGAAVTLTGRKAENLTAAVQQLQTGGADVRSFVCHQGDPAAISHLFEILDKA